MIWEKVSNYLQIIIIMSSYYGGSPENLYSEGEWSVISENLRDIKKPKKLEIGKTDLEITK